MVSLARALCAASFFTEPKRLATLTPGWQHNECVAQANSIPIGQHLIHRFTLEYSHDDLTGGPGLLFRPGSLEQF